MDLTDEEKNLIEKFRQAKKFAEGNGQASLEVRILPGGRVLLMNAGFQEKIEVKKPENNRQ